ncbi:hypothetical protein F4804DRAFT_173019 [Jackrogersella minutella]|nr:hypothetical protein F4804DRAFT_173019 [Jackrogersella minutella]
MEGSGRQNESRERSYPRAPSRASTASTANTQTTPKSATSSSSHLREISQTGSHPTHKYHQSDCGKGLGGGIQPASRLSREPSDELRKLVTSTPGSNLLQEKLRQVRKELHAAKMNGADLSVSIGDLREREVQNSPVRSATATGQRPQWPDNSDELAKDTGMGARQMEQTLSTLHKQNFDLKLEVHHRREKQVALEEKVEELESQRNEMESQCSRMESVVEKVDSERLDILRKLIAMENAFEDAVIHIVRLEMKINELLGEKVMTGQVETDGAYHHSLSAEQPNPEIAIVAAPNSTNVPTLGVPFLTRDGEGLGRVPSFLSDRSQQTETLRNALLRGRTSTMHLRAVSESSVAPSDIDRIASPSISMLSESSFVSIYGPKNARDNGTMPPSYGGAGMDGSYGDRSPTPTNTVNQESWGGPVPISYYSGGARLSKQMQSISNVLDTSSPLQKLERLEGQMVATDVNSGHLVPNQGRSTATPTPSRPFVYPPQQGKSKREKREALQKVLTNYPTNKDFSNPNALPPTPDTVSSSTLRKHHNFTSSQDSLPKQPGTIPSEGLVPVYDRIRAARESVHQPFSNQQSHGTAYPGRRQIPMPTMNTNPFSDLGHLARSLPPRPHSAAETTSSRARANSIGSDSDSDGGADARSEAESFDYWMRESMRPNEFQTGLSAQRGGRRSPSPPGLFSFPANERSLEPEVIFGALRSNGYLASPVSALRRDPFDEIGSSSRTPQTELFDPLMAGPAPPTPDRRSSLHARTGSTNTAPSSGGKFRKSLAKGPGMGWVDGRSRSNSIDTAAQGSSSRAHAQATEATTPGRRNHYPPISGQTPKGRGLGLNSFFRRAGSESFSVPSSATEANFPNPTLAQLSSLPPNMSYGGSSGRNSVPAPSTMPWRPPGVAGEDFKSATPPPIMRNRGQSLLSGTGSADTANPVTPQQQMADMANSSTPTTVIHTQGGNGNPAPSGNQPAGMRKWLGLGKMGGLKNKMG